MSTFRRREVGKIIQRPRSGGVRVGTNEKGDGRYDRYQQLSFAKTTANVAFLLSVREAAIMAGSGEGS